MGVDGHRAAVAEIIAADRNRLLLFEAHRHHAHLDGRPQYRLE